MTQIKGPEIPPQHSHKKLGMVEHTCNLVWGGELEGFLGLTGQHVLPNY